MELISEIKEYLKDKSICIKDGGSWALPFIVKPKDYDLIVWCENSIETRKYYLQKYKKVKEVSVFFKDKDYQQDDDIFFYYPYYWGEITEFDISKIDKYKQILLHRVQDANQRRQDPHFLYYESKFWYHIYIGLSAIKTRSYELTDQQKEDINMLHDREEYMLIQRQGLIDNMAEEIESWLI